MVVRGVRRPGGVAVIGGGGGGCGGKWWAVGVREI